MMTYELDDLDKEILMGKVVERPDLNDGRPLTEMSRSVAETRIRRDSGGWVIEARMPQGANVFQWVIKGWTSGTKKDAERSEREIRAEMARAK